MALSPYLHSHLFGVYLLHYFSILLNHFLELSLVIIQKQSLICPKGNSHYIKNQEGDNYHKGVLLLVQVLKIVLMNKEFQDEREMKHFHLNQSLCL